MRTYRNHGTGWWIAAIVLLAVVVIGIFSAVYLQSKRTVIATVTGHERVVEDDGNGGIDSYYIVFTTEGTFANKDSLFFGKFDSSDVQGSLEEDHTYEIEVIGWRFGLFSMYPNIIDVRREVEQ